MFMIEWTEFHDVRILFFSKVGGSASDLKKFSSDYVKVDPSLLVDYVLELFFRMILT